MNKIIKTSQIAKIAGFFISSAAITIGCSSGEEGAFRAGTNQTKPVPSLLSGQEKKLLGATENSSAVVATAAEYFFKLESNSGVEICTGEVAIQIMSNFALKLPEAKASCLGGSLQIDLGKILNGAGPTGAAPRMVAGLEHDGKVLAVESILGAKFNPPRPMLLGPIFQDRKIYEGYKKSTDHSMTNSAGKTAKGTFTIKVIDTNTIFKNDFVKEIKDVIQWEITSRGFEGMKATDGLIFDKISWWFGTRPIVIPKIIIEADLKDFIEDKTGIADIVGKLKITLGVKSFKS